MKRGLVVLIENIGELDSFTEEDMRRWWRNRCKKHSVGGEVYFEMMTPIRYNAREGVKRLESFGVKAHVARRPV
jgi:hypothetical protein